MMPFKCEAGVIALLAQPNIDTDVIMPKRFLLTIDRDGLGDGALHDLRFDEQHNPHANFVLNQPPWTAASFLAVGSNFGCGSSREHAVWGLMQLGIKAIIGTSFGGIFFDNAARNGLLLVELDEADARIVQDLAGDAARCSVIIDLERTALIGDNLEINFEIDRKRRIDLLQGRDFIDETIAMNSDIIRFETSRLARSPWLNQLKSEDR